MPSLLDLPPDVRRRFADAGRAQSKATVDFITVAEPVADPELRALLVRMLDTHRDLLGYLRRTLGVDAPPPG
jgi:hypothetical protein